MEEKWTKNHETFPPLMSTFAVTGNLEDDDVQQRTTDEFGSSVIVAVGLASICGQRSRAQT